VATRFAETDGRISPDARWLAYASNESGRSEVYVQSLADASSRYRVSTGGGSRPGWARNGKELFFVAGDVLQSVSLESGSGTALDASTPRDLFHLPAAADYAVARDGRILAAVGVDERPLASATVVLNWTSELRR
jgi:hypothetical protein